MKKTNQLELNLELIFQIINGIDKLKTTLFILSLPFVLILTSCSLKPTPIPDIITAEEYQVYHDLLLENPDMWNIPSGTEIMVFFDQTYVRHDPETVRSILGYKSNLTEKLIDNFLEVNQRTQSLKDQFALGIPAIFVENNTVQNLVRGLEFAEQCEFSIQAVYPKPRYGGFYYISRVGFDQQMKTALIYIEHSICGGSGNFLVMEKEAGIWKVSDFAMGLQSDLGLYLDDRLSDEEQTIYNAVLSAIDEFVLGDGYEYLTVFDQTGISDQLSQEKENLFALISMKLPDVTQEMLTNLTMLNTEPYSFTPRFSLDVPVVLVSWQEYWNLSQEMGEDACLSTLQERFPESTFQGWLRLSRVGFNQDGDKALVYLDSYQCKSNDFLFYLEKQHNIWTLVNYVAFSSLPK